MDLTDVQCDAGVENHFGLFALFLKGDDVQKISIIQALPQLCQIDQQATGNRIIPKIQQDLPSASSEFNVTASVIFSELIKNHKFPNLLTTVLKSIDCKDPIAANAWMEALLAIIPSLSEGPLKNQVLPVAYEKAAMSQSLLSRINSCRILGKISSYPKLKLINIQKDIVPLVLSLCQDVNHEVRATICTQLPHVTEGVGKDFMKTNLLPSLVELASDANPVVRGSSITTVVFILQYLDNETKANIMLPLVTQLCDKSMRKDDVTAGIIAAELGKMMDALRICMDTETGNWFMKCYKKLSQRGLSNDPGDVFSIDVSKEVMCRECCAMNLPFMANFTNTVLSAQMDLFYSIFRALAVDPCYIVRRTVAAHLHEIVEILQVQSKNLRSDIVRLLRDDAEEVLQELVPNLGKTLLMLQFSGILSREKQDMGTVDIGRALFKCHMELTKGYNWRLLCQFLVEMEQVPFCIPSDFIHQNFTPSVLGNAINGRVRPVRSQAVRTLLIFLRHNKSEVHQKWLRDTIIKQLCYSDSSYTRIIYVKCCEHVVEIFPDIYFQEHFLSPLLSLAKDPVSNIRYAFVNMLPTIKLVLNNTNTDLRYNNQLSETLRTMDQSEKDRDVKQWLQIKTKEMNSIPADLFKKRADIQKQLELLLTGSSNAIKVKDRDRDNGGLNRVYSQVTTSTSRLLAPKELKSYQSQQKPTPKANDMTILSQHFYIDAGINLPFSTITPSDNTDFSHGFSPPNQNSSELLDADNNLETAIKQLETLSLPSTTNITDDQKVTLRRISRIVPPKVKTASSSSKTMNRYSMSHCLDNDKTKLNYDEKKQMNRRSLNFTPREFSRIPIVNRPNNHSHSSSNGISTFSKAGNNCTVSMNLVTIQPEEPINSDERKELNSTNKTRMKRISGLPISINRKVMQ